ncbi:hypothetical protein B0H66DRAFT_640073 [Apodospora peruviana]|uniref:G domain-containing protein n=1 Tax=Apodospora peruviana TaxID=516989 RepID=A0AAE0I555_9PEZI|nr:hypothetical protein B0H66DRAFT_640073 [Apodospora peruviana]
MHEVTPFWVLRSLILNRPSQRLPSHSFSQELSTELRCLNQTESFQDKLVLLGADQDLGSSILTGIASVDGFGSYFDHENDDNHPIHAQPIMRCTVTVADEKLDIAVADAQNVANFGAVKDTPATHVVTDVVTGVTWGAQCILTASNEQVSSQDGPSDPENDVAAKFNRLSCTVNSVLNMSNKHDSDIDRYFETFGSFRVSVLSHIKPNNSFLAASFNCCEVFTGKLHKYIASCPDRKDTPISYTLLPLSKLASHGVIKTEDYLGSFTPGQWSPRKYLATSTTSKSCGDHFTNVVSGAKPTRQSFHPTMRLALALKATRRDATHADRLMSFLDDYQSHGDVATPHRIRSITSYSYKMDLADVVSQHGGTYVGYGEPTLNDLRLKNACHEMIILYFSDDDRLMVVVDCDATGNNSRRHTSLSAAAAGSSLRTWLNTVEAWLPNCIMQYKEDTIDRSAISKQVQRRAVKIACPHLDCDQTLACDWICGVCHSIVKYGHVDELFYCGCGAAKIGSWTFKCNDPRHGDRWCTYERSQLLSRLGNLKLFKDLQILIFGETGVGESTWINAYINYLAYDSLHDDLEAPELKWVVPCSFSTQLKDKDDPRGRFVKKDIKIGVCHNEHDGTQGQSATQCASVYTIVINSDTRIRLIDTPGVGDIRGLDQDNKNMADNLRTLRTYNELHGVLILLKPECCPPDSHVSVLHQAAVDSTAPRRGKEHCVGSTNTRGSNYKPGDTLKPLETLLHDYQDVEMGLFEHNVFCFDSESFRFLAARREGIMGNLGDNAHSWDY